MGNKNERDTSCSERVADHYARRMENIRKLYEAEDQTTPELGSLNEYGLSLDLVAAGTFKNQREDYKRYQLSWGGPSEEFRVYKNGDVEFWLLDWFDGAKVDVTGPDADIIHDIVDAVSWEVV